MHKIGICVLVAAGLAQAVRADNLSLVGGEATLPPGTVSSYWFTLGIASTAAPQDLAAWQLVCQIVPVAGATGTVHFVDFAQPPDYIFDDNSSGIGPPSGCTPTLLSVEDVAGTAVAVPISGQNLLQVELQSSNAQGRFDIVVVPGVDTGSAWMSPDYTLHDFDVVPAAGRPAAVVESVLFSSTPEPSSLVLLSVGMPLLMLYAHRRRKMCR